MGIGFLFQVFEIYVSGMVCGGGARVTGWKSRPLVNADAFLLTNCGSEAFFKFQVSSFRFQVSGFRWGD